MKSALNAIERALSLNASCATALYFGALIHAFAGHSGRGDVQRQSRAAAKPIRSFRFCRPFGARNGGRPGDALRRGGIALQQSRSGESPLQHLYMFHAASLALAGRLEEAESPVRQLLELEPQFRVRRLISGVRLAREVADKLVKGVSMLGLPE